MAILTNLVKSLELMKEFGIDVSEDTKNKLRDMGYILPEDTNRDSSSDDEKKK